MEVAGVDYLIAHPPNMLSIPDLQQNFHFILQNVNDINIVNMNAAPLGFAKSSQTLKRNILLLSNKKQTP
jgi:hypothetical protein